MSDTNLSHATVVPNTPPTVNIIACGGGGINMTRRSLQNIGDDVTYQYVDTSKANLLAGETALIIGSGGSGLVRSHNADRVVQAIAALSDEALGISDVNIVVFSLSGGSGSVIGPLLIRDIMSRRGKLTVALTISSTQSEKHTENTLRTLQSLRKITDDCGLYLPISIFDNTAGIQKIDRVMPYKLERLIDLLTKPTTEVDKNDRLHWINVPKTLGDGLKGLRLLHVTTEADADANSGAEVWPVVQGHIYDSVLALHAEEYSVTSKPRSRVSFEGLFSTIKLVPMYGVIGNPPQAFDDLVKRIATTLNDYHTNATQHDDPFNTHTSDQHKSGLIL